MMRTSRDRPQMRVPLPARDALPAVDLHGRRFRGKIAIARALYANERCCIDEIATYLQVPRHTVSYMLRFKGSEATRRVGLKTHGRGLVRARPTVDRVARAFVAWVASS